MSQFNLDNFYVNAQLNEKSVILAHPIVFYDYGSNAKSLNGNYKKDFCMLLIMIMIVAFFVHSKQFRLFYHCAGLLVFRAHRMLCWMFFMKAD